MAKNKLFLEDYFNFDLVGLVSVAREYKLVWSLNQVTDFQLVKQDDITLEFSGNHKISVSNFDFKKEHQRVSLLKNRLVAKPTTDYQFLISELKQFDYLLKYQDETGDHPIKDILSLIKTSPEIDYAAILDPSMIKSRDNLIF